MILVASCSPHRRGSRDPGIGNPRIRGSGAPNQWTSGPGLNSQRVCGQLGSQLDCVADLPGRSREREMKLEFLLQYTYECVYRKTMT